MNERKNNTIRGPLSRAQFKIGELDQAGEYERDGQQFKNEIKKQNTKEEEHWIHTKNL